MTTRLTIRVPNRDEIPVEVIPHRINVCARWRSETIQVLVANLLDGQWSVEGTKDLYCDRDEAIAAAADIVRDRVRRRYVHAQLEGRL